MFRVFKICTLLLLFLCFVVSPVAAKSKVKGDPKLIWLSPLGKDDIKNNAYNRCLLVKAVRPGAEQATTTQRNNYDILAKYASDLYAQSIKIASYINSENDKIDTSSSNTINLDTEQEIIKREITGRLYDISRRLNIIVSFEAGTEALNIMREFNRLPNSTYVEFRALVGGHYDYATGCEVLKE